MAPKRPKEFSPPLMSLPKLRSKAKGMARAGDPEVTETVHAPKAAKAPGSAKLQPLGAEKRTELVELDEEAPTIGVLLGEDTNPKKKR